MPDIRRTDLFVPIFKKFFCVSHQPERKEKKCLNCGAEVVGRFCHVCGQGRGKTAAKVVLLNAAGFFALLFLFVLFFLLSIFKL